MLRGAKNSLVSMMDEFSLDAYAYDLPQGLIAQHPAPERDRSRLLVLDRSNGKVRHSSFHEFPSLLQPGDCLILNDSKVFPARLLGKKVTGGQVEIFLLHFPAIEEPNRGRARALARCSKGLKPGQKILFGSGFEALVEDLFSNGEVEIELHSNGQTLAQALDSHGSVPLPPYIKRSPCKPDRARYQTIYADKEGSVAAPTAGLHFTGEILNKLAQRGVEVCRVTLHVGYGTFAPIRAKDVRRHEIHSEWLHVTRETAAIVNSTKRLGGRVVCVGTTSVRALEFAAQKNGEVAQVQGECDLYIYPGYEFKIVDAMLTNFHLPRSSLLVLVSAFAGRERILRAYEEAISKGYRFYSYGDAMFIT